MTSWNNSHILGMKWDEVEWKWVASCTHTCMGAQFVMPTSMAYFWSGGLNGMYIHKKMNKYGSESPQTCMKYFNLHLVWSKYLCIAWRATIYSHIQGKYYNIINSRSKKGQNFLATWKLLFVWGRITGGWSWLDPLVSLGQSISDSIGPKSTDVESTFS